MKRHLLRNFAILSLCASFAFAQQTGGTAPTPAQMAAHQVARLTSLLTLTTAQQAQATTIFTNEATAAAALQPAMTAAHTALQTAITKNDTAGIATQSAAIGSLTTQSTQIRADAQAAFYQILTPEQQTKFAASGARGMGGQMRGGFGGPAGFRGTR